MSPTALYGVIPRRGANIDEIPLEWFSAIGGLLVSHMVISRSFFRNSLTLQASTFIFIKHLRQFFPM